MHPLGIVGIICGAVAYHLEVAKIAAVDTRTSPKKAHLYEPARERDTEKERRRNDTQNGPINDLFPLYK